MIELHRLQKLLVIVHLGVHTYWLFTCRVVDEHIHPFFEGQVFFQRRVTLKILYFIFEVINGSLYVPVYLLQILKRRYLALGKLEDTVHDVLSVKLIVDSFLDRAIKLLTERDPTLSEHGLEQRLLRQEFGRDLFRLVPKSFRVVKTLYVDDLLA